MTKQEFLVWLAAREGLSITDMTPGDAPAVYARIASLSYIRGRRAAFNFVASEAAHQACVETQALEWRTQKRIEADRRSGGSQ